MPTVMAYHDVKDKDHWLASPKREEFFGPLGVTNIRTFVDPENPTRVGLVMDVSDMDAVMAAMETEAAADAMAHDGVLARDARDPRRGIAGAGAVPLVDVQLVQERERVVEGLEQILVVLDHLAAHVDAKPLLVDVQLIAIEHVSER